MLQGFVLPVLEFCSVMWCSTANTHLRLFGRVVSGAFYNCLSPMDQSRDADLLPFDNIIIIYHDSLPTLRRDSHVKSDKTHTHSHQDTPP